MDRLIHGDCLAVMRTLDENSIDAVVSDPPYGLDFMGQDWDYGIPGTVFWEEAFRLAKPGAYLLAFGGTRTYHRLACNIEDAGWEIRDCLVWLYGAGFPKSYNVEKAMDKVDADMAQEYKGFGTALKPAWEPIIMARKPPKGTIIENVLTWGPGGLNIDACRIGEEIISYGPKSADDQHPFEPKLGKPTIHRSGFAGSTHVGRWPANAILDEDVGAELNERLGYEASRYFYCPKSTPAERNRGLDDLEAKPCGVGALRDNGRGKVAKNTHPTVKPLALMRYLCRLVTPPRGIVLDPFCGSGSTLVAAKAEGFQYVGIDIMEEYINIAAKRLDEQQVEASAIEKERKAQTSLDMW